MKLNTKIITTGLMTVITCALVGSVTGTFAWYAYSTRATAELTGTTFGKATNLQLGIVAPENTDNIQGWDDFVTKSGLKGEGNIYWSYLGGGLSQSIIEDYLELVGHSRKDMRPTTSGVYTKSVDNPEFDKSKLISAQTTVSPTIEEQVDIQPKVSPYDEQDLNENASRDADKKDYAVLPLAIRVKDLKNDEVMNDIDIYVSDLDFSAIGNNGVADNKGDLIGDNISEAFRLDFFTWNEGKENLQRKIVSPGRTDDGEIKIGGLLDTDLDGFVDVDIREDNSVVDYDYLIRSEYLYGAVKNGQEGNNHFTYENVRYSGYKETPTSEVEWHLKNNKAIYVYDEGNNTGSIVYLFTSSEAVHEDANDSTSPITDYNYQGELFSGKTFNSQYQYVENENYNSNDPSSYPYVPRLRKVYENTVSWTMKDSENPFFNKDNREDCLDEEKASNYYYAKDNNEKWQLLKSEGKANDLVLLKDGTNYSLIKKSEIQSDIEGTYSSAYAYEKIGEKYYKYRRGLNNAIDETNEKVFENAYYVADGESELGFKIDISENPTNSLGKVSESVIVKNGDEYSVVARAYGHDDITKIYNLNSNAYEELGDNELVANHLTNSYYAIEGTQIKAINNPKLLKNHFVVKTIVNNNLVNEVVAIGSSSSYDYKGYYEQANQTYAKIQEKKLYENTDSLSGYNLKVNLNETNFDGRKHQAKTYTIANYEAFTQKFIGRDSLVAGFTKGKINSTDKTSKVLCNTGNSNGIAYCKLTMWIEGWDASCDENILDVSYGLGIQFQIDRLDK